VGRSGPAPRDESWVCERADPIKFSPDCWQLIRGLRSRPTSPPLAAELHTILGAGPAHRDAPADAGATTHRRGDAGAVEELERWLRQIVESLSGDRFGRRTCLKCISAVVLSLGRAVPSSPP
jgi:hypothetical protein